MPVGRDVDQQEQELQPDHDRCRVTAANGAQRREAQLAEHQHIVQRDVQQGARHPVEHGRPGIPGALAEIPQQQHQAQPRRSPGDGPQVTCRLRHDLRVDTKRHKQWLAEVTDAPVRHAQHQRDPQRLAGLVSGFGLHVRPVQLGHAGLYRHQRADHEHQDGRPYRPADAQRRQRDFLVRQPPRHHGIDEIHAENGDLPDDDGRRQVHGAADLGEVIFFFGYTVHPRRLLHRRAPSQ